MTAAAAPPVGRAFLRGIVVLAGAMAVARLIPAATSPVLSRLFAPEDFGVYALFTAIISAVLPALGMRYEMAVLVPTDPAEADALVSLAFAISVGVAALSLPVLLVASTLQVGAALRSLGGFLYMMPLALLLNGAVVALTQQLNRLGRDRMVAASLAANAVAVAAVSIAFGVFDAGPRGLIVGYLVGLALGAGLLWRHRGLEISVPRVMADPSYRRLARRYRDYPLYNATGALLVGVASSLPVFFLTRYFPLATVGLYTLGMRAVTLPLNFLAESVSLVNMRRTAELARAGGALRGHALRLAAALSAVAAIPWFVIGMVGPDLFGWVFGAEWVDAGRYLQILMPGIAVRFVVASLSTMLNVLRANRAWAAWTTVSFVAQAAVFAALAPRGDLELLLLAVVFTEVALYLTLFAVILGSIGRTRG